MFLDLEIVFTICFSHLFVVCGTRGENKYLYHIYSFVYLHQILIHLRDPRSCVKIIIFAIKMNDRIEIRTSPVLRSN